MTTNQGIIYVVATCIGNLEDITFRAVKVLKSVDLILCEDTRNSLKLLNHYNIDHKKLLSYHKFNEKNRLEYIKNLLLNENKNIALISDAGTPCIQDPGRVLINELTLNTNIKIVPIPGACAFITLLCATFKIGEDFIFLGFPPKTFEQQKKLFLKNNLADIIFYESNSRILKTLENILNIFGPNILISVGRELTKIYEEIKFDKVINIIDFYKTNTPKGEFVVVIHKENKQNIPFDEDILIKIQNLKDKGFSKKDIINILVALYGFNKNDIYNKI